MELVGKVTGECVAINGTSVSVTISKAQRQHGRGSRQIIRARGRGGVLTNSLPGAGRHGGCTVEFTATVVNL